MNISTRNGSGYIARKISASPPSTFNGISPLESIMLILCADAISWLSVISRSGRVKSDWLFPASPSRPTNLPGGTQRFGRGGELGLKVVEFVNDFLPEIVGDDG